MKISYMRRWDPATGTTYHQTFRITEEENQQLFDGRFSPGMNYGNADTGHRIATRIFNLPEYQKQLKRIIVGNSAIFVGSGRIPVYYD